MPSLTDFGETLAEVGRDCQLPSKRSLRCVDSSHVFSAFEGTWVGAVMLAHADLELLNRLVLILLDALDAESHSRARNGLRPGVVGRALLREE